jgi:uncharacterized protein (TIGR00251 family)
MLTRLANGDVLLQLHVQPGASRDQFLGLHGGAIKVAIKAPPVDGKANAHLQQFLALCFDVPKRQVLLEKGELSRQKKWRIVAPCSVPDALQLYLES